MSALSKPILEFKIGRISNKTVSLIIALSGSADNEEVKVVIGTAYGKIGKNMEFLYIKDHFYSNLIRFDRRQQKAILEIDLADLLQESRVHINNDEILEPLNEELEYALDVLNDPVQYFKFEPSDKSGSITPLLCEQKFQEQIEEEEISRRTKELEIDSIHLKEVYSGSFLIRVYMTTVGMKSKSGTIRAQVGDINGHYGFTPGDYTVSASTYYFSKDRRGLIMNLILSAIGKAGLTSIKNIDENLITNLAVKTSRIVNDMLK